ncbi:hypothetical protein HK102_009599 [Quaeritorhiza haematococci]|nr:hypothetical protein HK102_009599 [Quaeritorhiza haematococci]
MPGKHQQQKGKGKRARPSGNVGGAQSNGSGGRVAKRPRVSGGGNNSKNTTVKWDVFEASDEEQGAQFDGAGNDVDNYEYDPDKPIDSEDDEEIDEDEAFNDEDEERFGTFFEGRASSSSKKPGKVISERNLLDEDDDEDDEDVDDEDDEDAIDLSDMLNDSQPAAASKKRKTLATLMPSTNDSESEGDEDAVPMSDSDRDQEEDEDEEMDDGLLSIVNSLGNTKTQQKSKQGFGAKERTEAFDESEYNLGSKSWATSSSSAKGKLALNDLVGVLKDTTGFGGLKKQLETLESAAETAKKGGKNAGGSGKSDDVVNVPLPKRMQDRLNRSAAFDEAKKEVSKWVPLVKKNREADHLVFTGSDAPANNISNGALVGKFEAETSMEKEIQNLLEASQLTEKKQAEIEELELNKISKEELVQRRAELAKMRSLLFFQEQKAKQMAKIKSKTYHKIRRKQKERLEEREGGLTTEEIQDLDPESARAELMKMEAKRAKERMTLKHKNSGKWAKRMLQRKGLDNETRQALMEQLRKHEELTRKIQGLSSGDDSDGNSSGNEDEEDEEIITTGALNRLDDLERSVDNADEELVPKTGIFAMKFMKKGFEAQQRAAKEQIAKLRMEMEAGNFSDEEDEEDKNGKIKKRKDARSEDESDDESEDDDVDRSAKDLSTDVSSGVKMTAPISIEFDRKKGQSKQSAAATSSKSKKDGDAANKSQRKGLAPLFNVESFEVNENAHEGTINSKEIPGSHDESDGDEKAKLDTSAPVNGKKGSKVVVDDDDSNDDSEDMDDEDEDDGAEDEDEDHDGDDLAGGNPWLSGGAAEADDVDGEQEDEQDDDAKVQLSTPAEAFEVNKEDEDGTTTNTTAGKTTSKSKSKSKSASKSQKVEPREPEMSDADSDVEADVGASGVPNDLSKLSQKDVMVMAFGDDNIEDEFEEEKMEIMEEGKPKEEDLTLPGWGSWGGTKLKPKSRVVVKKLKPGEGIDPTKRKDAKLKNVMINEKKDKKAFKFKIPEVPHGFETREQYEKTIRVPLGKEWNTSHVHQDSVRPRVQVKEGAVIHPLKFMASQVGNKKKK